MTRQISLVGALVAAAAAAACREQPVQPASFETVAAPLALTAAGPLDRASVRLPFGTLLDLGRPVAAERAINPGDYACSESSPITRWLSNEVAKTLAVEPDRFWTVYSYLGDLIPTYEAIIFETTDRPQSFGVDGRHTKGIRKAERDLKAFWDITSSDIQVVAMHGSVLLDTARTRRTYQALGVPSFFAGLYSRTVRDAVAGSQTMADGDHPYWTFNAVAFSTGTNPTAIPDKIVMGDGILAGYDALGFGDVAPQAIFAHEFAHHVQFENGYGIAGDAAEQTRFNELGADAMAAYWLTHARGAAMNRKRVEQFLQVFYQLGDCQFAGAGQHGTPNQRLAAARFGFDLAEQAQKQGHVMRADKAQMAFIVAYPGIVAPDAH